MKFGIHRIIFFSALVAAVSPAFAAVHSFAAAKAQADADEAAASRTQLRDLLASQNAAIDRIIPQCMKTYGAGGMPPFVVVAKLDGNGRVAMTWRQGDTAFAACFEGRLGTLSLFVPPHAPFYTSFEMSLSPGH